MRCLIALLLLIFSPVITFGCGWLGGWILMKIIGVPVVNGLNLLFDTARFTTNLIPITCGILATVGSYFKSTQTNNSK